MSDDEAGIHSQMKYVVDRNMRKWVNERELIEGI